MCPGEGVQAVFADMNRHVNEGEEYIVTDHSRLAARPPAAPAHHAGGGVRA